MGVDHDSEQAHGEVVPVGVVARSKHMGRLLMKQNGLWRDVNNVVGEIGTPFQKILFLTNHH